MLHYGAFHLGLRCLSKYPLSGFWSSKGLSIQVASLTDTWIVRPSSLCYCKFGNFRDNFIFVNSVKRHICDVKKSRLGHELPISVQDRVITPVREDLIFTKFRICEVLQK